MTFTGVAVNAAGIFLAGLTAPTGKPVVFR